MSSPPSTLFQNWGRCWGACTPSEIIYPTSTAEVRQTIVDANRSKPVKKIRLVGRGMAPSDMLFTTGAMLRTDKMNRVLKITSSSSSSSSSYVTFEAGATIAEVAAALVPHELVLPNAISVKRTSLAATCLVAGHGTGFRNGTFAEAIAEIRGVTGAGDVLFASELTGENKELLPALRCSLGLLCCVTEMTLRVEKRVEHIMESSDITMDELFKQLPERKRLCSHYKFVTVPFTNHCFETWAVPTKAASSSAPVDKAKQEEIFAQRIAFAHRCSSDGNDSLTRRLTERGYYYAHDSRFLTTIVNKIFARNVLSGRSRVEGADVLDINYLDVLFGHVTLEWAVASRHCEAAIREWYAIIEANKHLMVHLLEVRFNAAENTERVWLSPSVVTEKEKLQHPEDGICYIGIIIFQPFGLESKSLRETCARFQDLMLKYGGRSHWSKPFEVEPRRLHSMYPKLAEFEALRKKMDPNDIFTTEYYTRKLSTKSLEQQKLTHSTPLPRSKL